MDIPDLDGNDDQLVVHYYYGNCHSVSTNYDIWYWCQQDIDIQRGMKSSSLKF